MTLPLSFYVCITALLLGFGMGFYTEFKLTEAAQEVQISKQLKAAQSGEVKLITNSQVITKAVRHAKDSCIDKSVPTDVNNILRHPGTMPGTP